MRGVIVTIPEDTGAIIATIFGMIYRGGGHHAPCRARASYTWDTPRDTGQTWDRSPVPKSPLVPGGVWGGYIGDNSIRFHSRSKTGQP